MRDWTNKQMGLAIVGASGMVGLLLMAPEAGMVTIVIAALIIGGSYLKNR